MIRRFLLSKIIVLLLSLVFCLQAIPHSPEEIRKKRIFWQTMGASSAGANIVNAVLRSRGFFNPKTNVPFVLSSASVAWLSGYHLWQVGEKTHHMLNKTK